MAGTITINTSFVYSDNGVSVSDAVTNLVAVVTGNGINNLPSSTVTTSSTAIPLGGVTSPGGWFFVFNTDATNYISIQTAASGTNLLRIYPGTGQLFQLDPALTAPGWIAHTASCVVRAKLFDL